jgi:hypothetical protein
MRFDDAGHDIHTVAMPRLRCRQHLIGLADTWGRAKEYLEPASAFLAGGLLQQGLGGRAAIGRHQE